METREEIGWAADFERKYEHNCRLRSLVSDVTYALAAKCGGSITQWDRAWDMASSLPELDLQELAQELRYEGWL